MGVQSALTIEDLKKMARRRVPKMFFDYIDSGALTEQTYRDNESDFHKIKLKQRVGRSLRDLTMRSKMVGQDFSMPFGLAPTGLTGMQYPEGEIAVARAAHKAGIPYTLSTMSICSIEDVADAVSEPFWFQLYVMRDRNFLNGLIDRAKAAECSALVITMDLQLLAQRHKDIRNGMSVPPQLRFQHLWQMAMRPRWCLGMLGTDKRTFRNVVGHAPDVRNLKTLGPWTEEQFDPDLNWDAVGEIKDRWGGKVIVKGVLDPEDAQMAVDAGADGVIVSNHGGRQLDGAWSSIRMLPQVVEALGAQTEIYMDGGINTGIDIARALALGAHGVFVGRAFLYGLAAGGEAGVSRAIDILGAELEKTMAFCGEQDIQHMGMQNIQSLDF